jgi:UDP-N-acetylmuramoyl-tripeptide--D-alanyl-D-alanine ligase
MLHRVMLPHVTYVAVTGSCAKTTTTRLIGTVLETAGRCRTKDNNGLGHLSRNVLSVGFLTRFCVQEVSGEHPGRIRLQTRILRPQIGVVTNIGGDHYKKFRSLEATATEKGRLVEDLPRRGIAILNVDDPNVRGMQKRTRARVVTFGLSPDADVTATGISSNWPDRLAVTVAYGKESRHVQTRLNGEFWTTSVLAAVACGIACGLDLRTCTETIAAVEPNFGRYSVHQVPGGPVFVLDHKAPFWTIPHCLGFLASAKARRKTVIFGTISDYAGSGSARYRRVARQALEVADRVVFVGPNAWYVNKLRQGEIADRLFTFQTAFEASAYFKEHALPDELIVLKGSMFVDHLERIMLSQCEPVVCWRENCGFRSGCPQCSRYTRPHPPEFQAKSPAKAAVERDKRPQRGVQNRVG